MLLCVEVIFAYEHNDGIIKAMATTHLSSRRCHLLEDFVLGVSFYCLALFNKIEDKMNKKTYSP